MSSQWFGRDAEYNYLVRTTLFSRSLAQAEVLLTRSIVAEAAPLTSTNGCSCGRAGGEVQGQLAAYQRWLERQPVSNRTARPMPQTSATSVASLPPPLPSAATA